MDHASNVQAQGAHRASHAACSRSIHLSHFKKTGIRVVTYKYITRVIYMLTTLQSQSHHSGPRDWQNTVLAV
jgi:hypothetical protein